MKTGKTLTKPEEGEEQEDSARLDGACNFTDEFIVPGDLGGDLAVGVARCKFTLERSRRGV